MGVASGYISGQRHLRFLLFSDKDPSSLTLRIAVGTPQQLDWTSYSDKLADPIYPMPPSSDNLKEPHKRVHFSVVLLQTARWMTAFLWQLQMRKSYRALWLTPPSCRHPLNATPSSPRQRSSPFFPEVHDELTKSWRAPYLSRIRPSDSTALASVDGAEDKEYERLPPLDESVAAHFYPPMAIGWKARASHPSKPCRATSELARHAYSAAGQAALALHSMAMLQVFQAKMLTSEEAGLDAASLRERASSSRSASAR